MLIPFDKNGNMLIYPENNVIWKDRYPFFATITYIETLCYNRPIVFMLQDINTKIIYYMAAPEMDMMLKNKNVNVNKNTITGTFEFHKNNGIYGIKFKN